MFFNMKHYIVLKNILNFVAKLNSLVCFLLLLNVIFMKRKIKGIFTCLQRLFNVNENGNMNLNDEFCERFVWMACDDDAFDGAESFDLFDA